MGYGMLAKCKNCDFTKEFFYGAGRLNYTTEADVPAIDNTTGEFVVENYMNKKKLKSKVTFYTELSMFKLDTSSIMPENNTKDSGNFISKLIFRVKDIFRSKRAEKEALQKLIKEGGHHWGNTYLQYRNNLCPKCKEYTLSFHKRRFFD